MAIVICKIINSAAIRTHKNWILDHNMNAIRVRIAARSHVWQVVRVWGLTGGLRIARQSVQLVSDVNVIRPATSSPGHVGPGRKSCDN